MQTLENLERKFLSIIPIKHLETHGFTPDINCPDGTDAFAVAMAQIEKAKTLQSQTPER